MITEDAIASHIYSIGGVLNTRKINNITSVNFNNLPSPTFVCLTGADFILEDFFTNYIEFFKNQIIMVTIETDFFTLYPKYINHNKIKKWYTWNKQYTNPQLICIPIGLNNDRQNKSLTVWLKKNNLTIDNLQTSVKSKLLCVNCSPNTNVIRKSLVEKAQNEWSSFCDFVKGVPPLCVYYRNCTGGDCINQRINITMTNPDFYDCIKDYKFILSPPGAGEDCHRTWEALYLGCIPIVRSSSINELYKDLPVVVVESFDIISKEFLYLKYIEIAEKKLQNKYNYSKLYNKYWIDMIMKG